MILFANAEYLRADIYEENRPLPRTPSAKGQGTDSASPAGDGRYLTFRRCASPTHTYINQLAGGDNEAKCHAQIHTFPEKKTTTTTKKKANRKSEQQTVALLLIPLTAKYHQPPPTTHHHHRHWRSL